MQLTADAVAPDIFRRPCTGGDLAPRLIRRAERFISHGWLSGEICEQLAQDYVQTRHAEATADEFLVALARLVEDFSCHCGCAVAMHHCALRDCYSTPAPLQDLFRRECGLNFELFAQVQWCSWFHSQCVT